MVLIPLPLAAGCGAQAQACEIAQGQYHVLLPDMAPKGAIMFLHGWGGSGEGVLKGDRFVPEMRARGYAVIAPEGMPRSNGGGRRWFFHPDWPQDRDDIAFLAAVRDDASARFGLDPQRISLSGFSIGGTMAHYAACAAPDAFHAYLPIGGAFWRPHPDGCAGPVRLLHSHGWRDTTVPLEGRVLRGGDATNPDAMIQGDIFYAMDLWRQANACHQLRGDVFDTDAAFWRRAWTRCAEGTALELVLFPGGHVIPEGWADLALDWLEKL